MEPTLETGNIRKAALTNGLIWAFIDVVIFLLVYYVKPDLLGAFAWGAMRFLIGLGLAVYFSLDLRKKAGGYWSFKEALGSIFTMFIVSALVVFLFTIIFGKYIEPQYAVTMKELTINNTVEVLEKIGMDQEEIDKAIADAESKMDQQFNPGFSDLLMSIGIMIIMYFIGALIFAAIFKRDRPYYVQTSEE